jgi:hypothetical protein
MADYTCNLRGMDGWAAYQAYLSFIHFLPVLERYRASSEFNTKALVIDNFKSLSDDEKATIIIELMAISTIDDKDLQKLLGIFKDSGRRLGVEIIKGLELVVIAKLVVESIVACSQIDSELFF